MDVKINQVILHILDAGASEPVLSDRPMELDADLYEYFSVCIEKAFASDDSKDCRFLPFCRRCSTTMTLLTFRAVLRV